MPAFGIDISDRSIKYAKLLPHEGGFRLGAFGEISLQPGIVESGRIVSREGLTLALVELKRKEGMTFVRAAVPDEQVYFFRMGVPNGSRAALRETIELSLDEHVPVAASEAVFDFEVVGTNGADVEVAVTVAAASVVESYVDAFSKAGLTLLSLELEAAAVARTIIRKGDSAAHLVVDFGEARTGIAVVCGGQVCLTSTVSLGGQMLTETLAKHFSISLDEAEKMKRDFGLRRDGPDDLFSLLLNNVAVLRDEINRHFVYWHSHPDDTGAARPVIGEIVLIGGDSNLSGLSDYLSASLRVKVSSGDVWANVGFPEVGVPDLGKKESLGYATAIGLSLHALDGDHSYHE